VNILSGEDVIYVGDWFELGPGEVRDLGTLETEGAGSLEIELARPAGAESLEPRVWIKNEASSHGRWVEFGTDSVKLAGNLNPGLWSLSMYGDGFASDWGEVEVHIDETATIRFELRLAVKRELEIAYPDNVTLTELHLRLVDAAGRELWDHADRRPAERGRPYRRTLPLPLGRIHVQVSTDADVSGSLDFEMTSLEPGQTPVQVVLH
jgi:hypothetical protein